MKGWMPESEWSRAMDALEQLPEIERSAYEPVFGERRGTFSGLICKDKNCRRWAGRGHEEDCLYREVLRYR